MRTTLRPVGVTLAAVMGLAVGRERGHGPGAGRALAGGPPPADPPRCNATIPKDGAGEQFGWGINYYAGGFVQGYERTKDTAWLDGAEKSSDYCIEKMRTGPDGYKGWVGEDQSGRGTWADNHVGDAIIVAAHARLRRGRPEGPRAEEEVRRGRPEVRGPGQARSFREVGQARHLEGRPRLGLLHRLGHGLHEGSPRRLEEGHRALHRGAVQQEQPHGRLRPAPLPHHGRGEVARPRLQDLRLHQEPLPARGRRRLQLLHLELLGSLRPRERGPGEAGHAAAG